MNFSSGKDGRSLENSYTNIFALTDLSGINFKKYTLKVEKNYNLHNDPILMSYSNCLKQNFMCAWVRCKKDDIESPKPYVFEQFSKELWVFWYGTGESMSVERLILPELCEASSGNWKKGLCYETRCILFKALHNVVERYLLNKGFNRLGKWFLQPCSSLSNRDKVQYSVSFSFFLHGESTVCTSLDIRQFPKVKTLDPRILSKCLKQNGRVNVILSPYGISAQLIAPSTTNASIKDPDLEHWRHFFPIKFDDEINQPNTFSNANGFSGNIGFSTPNKSSPGQYSARGDTSAKKSHNPTPDILPKFVDILLGGYRMRYPACFVLLLEESLTIDPTSSSEMVIKSESAESKEKTAQVCKLISSSRPRLPLVRLPNSRHRAYLANRTLCRALRCNPSLISIDHNRRRLLLDDGFIDCYARLVPRSVPSSISASTAEAVNGPLFPKPEANQNIKQSQPLHRRAAPLSSMLRKFLNEVDNGSDHLHNVSPVPHVASTDPMMPTLSPQQPAVVLGAATLTVATPLTVNTTVESASLQPTITGPLPAGAGGKGPLNMPPCLLNCINAPPVGMKESPPSKPMDWEPIQATKLPFGVIRTTSNQAVSYLAPPMTTSHMSNVSVRDPLSQHSWLIGQAMNELQHGYQTAYKRPYITMSLVDRMNDLEHVSAPLPLPTSHLEKQFIVATKVGLDDVPITRKYRQVGSYGDREPPIHLETHAFNSDESQYHHQQLQQRVAYKAEHPCYMSIFDKDTDMYSVDEHFREIDEETSIIKGENSTHIMRTLSRYAASGRSLTSSSGSGHIGPAQLAAMLPTPPSYDVHQASPESMMTSMMVAVGSSSGLNSAPHASNFANTNFQQPYQGEFSSYGIPGQSANDRRVQNLMRVLFPSSQKAPSDLELGYSSQEWLFMRPRSVFIPMSAKFKLSSEEYQFHKDALPVLPLSYDHRALPSGPLDLFEQIPSPKNNKHISPCVSTPKPSVQDVFNSLKIISSKSPIESFDLSDVRESDALKVNIILSDSLLNIFKDHNFDSCNICECTTSVLGAEIDIYVPNSDVPSAAITSPTVVTPGTLPPSALRTPMSATPWGAFSADDLLCSAVINPVSRPCTCGFSALVNRRFAVAGNLFFEDEKEVSALSVARFFQTSERPQGNCEMTTHLPVAPPLTQPPTYARPDGWWGGKSIPTASNLDMLAQWTKHVLLEFGIKFLIDWLEHSDLTGPSSPVGKDSIFDYTDACSLTVAAIEQSLFVKSDGDDSQGMVTSQGLILDEVTRDEGIAFHSAFFNHAAAKIPHNKNDQIRLLESVRPWLQEAISSTRPLESTYKVDGPLTWKAFHQLAGRGTSESCKPQPIPQFLVGGPDKENMLIAPFGIRDWDCLALVPLSRPKRVAFAVLLPASHCPQEVCQRLGVGGLGDQHISSHQLPSSRIGAGSGASYAAFSSIVTFFQELCYAFENCQLGQHYPYNRPTAGSTENAFIPIPSLHDEIDVDPATISSLAPMLPPTRRRLLRRLQRAHIPAPEIWLQHLQAYVAGAIHCSLTALSQRGVAMPNGAPSSSFAFPFNSSATRNVNPIASKTSPVNGVGPASTAFDSTIDSDITLLIYLVNPFTQYADIEEDVLRITTQALAGAATCIVSRLPESWRQRVSVQLLPLEQIFSISASSFTSGPGLPHIKSMAIAAYTTVDRLIQPSLVNANRTLTGMGPAAEKEVISADNEQLHARRIYSPAYTLAASRDLWGQWDVHPSEPLESSSVLFVSYCLSEDRRWLLATCTDEAGALMEQTFINITIPESLVTSTTTTNPSDEGDCDISSRRLGLACLWDFIINVLASTANPWRLVIGRLGRLGHGELKSWSGLLSRKNLQSVNRSLRSNCTLCNLATRAAVSSQSGHPNYQGTLTKTISLIADGVNSAGVGGGGSGGVVGDTGVNSCSHELPSLISACLVSMEPQTTFRVFPCSDLHVGDSWLNSAGGGGGGSAGGGGSGGGQGGGSGTGAGATSSSGAAGNCPFKDLSASPVTAPSTTHILVFPTSTSARALSEHDNIDFREISSSDMMLDFNLDYLPAISQEPTMCSGSSNVVGDERCSLQINASSGGPDAGANLVEPDTTGLSYEEACHKRAKFFLSEALLPFGVPDPQLEKPSLMQQPEALGYYVSTAPTGPLPNWFWAACQPTQNQLPTCLKSALHLHCSLVGTYDDASTTANAAPVLLPDSSTSSTSTGAAVSASVAASRPSSPCGGGEGSGYAGHLLDSNITCDVLRFVLESYNSLSWLTYDPVLNDRRSCLPVHILTLAQLYQATKAFT